MTLKKEKMILGGFIKLTKPGYLEKAVKEIARNGGNALMFFLGSPQTYQVVKKENLNVQLFHKTLAEKKISLKDVSVHLPYLINLGNCINERVFDLSLSLLKRNLELCDYLKVQKVVLHPGSALKSNIAQSTKQVAKGLDVVLAKHPNIQICLETMSGRGTQLGKNFHELKMIIEASKFSKQIGVCFDTCHLYSAGYDLVKNLDKVIETFDQTIGLNKLWLCHINDSKGDFNSNQDLHANIGEGKIGLIAIQKFIHHPKLKEKTMILETPFIDGQPNYKQEIASLINEKE